jgi:membrane protein
MNLPFFIARRYLFSKKSTAVINVISAISVVGVAIATMALVVILSVFNGFHDLVASLFTNFDPQIQVVPAVGKTIPADAISIEKIKKMPQVAVATECVEDMALAVYRDKQLMVRVKGVQDNFPELTNIQKILYGEGSFETHAGILQYGIFGVRAAQSLGFGTRWEGFLHIYAPIKEGQVDPSNPTTAFVVDSLLSPDVIFIANQQKYDKDHVVTSIDFARNLFGEQGMISSLEIKLKPGADVDAVKKEMQNIGGKELKVLDRFEQQEDTFKIMQVEKMIAYIFLTFIVIVASFNIIGSLSMLILDKKNDVETLRKLGATDKQIVSIFLFEGRLIAFIGALLGISLGLLLCWLQQTFGLVALGESSGTFIVNAYPVSVHYIDVLLVLITVIITGWLSVWYPVRTLSKRFLK